VIGAKAVLLDLFPCVVLGVFYLVFALGFLSEKKAWKRGGVWGLLVFLLLLTGLFVPGKVIGLRDFRMLHALDPATVEAITLDRQTITDRSAIAAVSSALHHLQWFSSSHAGWAREVPLQIRFRSGREKKVSVALYLRQHGAVIRGLLGNPRFYTIYDCGFSAELPDVLAQLDAPLPAER